MIVAEKQRYYTAPVERRPVRKTGKGRRAEAGKSKRLRALSRVCVALAVAMLIISRFAVISEYNHSIRMLEAQLEELKRVNERLELQNAQAQDINKIEEYAIGKLGMCYPESRDIVYVAVERNEGSTFAVRMDDQEPDGGYGTGNWFAVLVSRVNKGFFQE